MPLFIVGALVIIIPVVSFALTVGIFVNLLQLGLALAIGGYLLGIPYAIAFRAYKGRWPSYE